jgi:hypothetical protein
MYDLLVVYELAHIITWAYIRQNKACVHGKQCLLSINENNQRKVVVVQTTIG